MKIDGITLLQMIKDKKIKENTKINVCFSNGIVWGLKTTIKYQNGNLNWNPGSFRVAMLYDDNYSFEIIEEKPKEIEEIEEIEFCGCNIVLRKSDTEGTLIPFDVPLCMEYALKKINELIKEVNLLKKEDDKND